MCGGRVCSTFLGIADDRGVKWFVWPRVTRGKFPKGEEQSLSPEQILTVTMLIIHLTIHRPLNILNSCHHRNTNTTYIPQTVLQLMINKEGFRIDLADDPNQHAITFSTPSSPFYPSSFPPCLVSRSVSPHLVPYCHLRLPLHPCSSGSAPPFSLPFQCPSSPLELFCSALRRLHRTFYGAVQ